MVSFHPFLTASRSFHRFPLLPYYFIHSHFTHFFHFFYSFLLTQWDVVLSNTLIKTGLGFGGGVLASVLFFRRRAFPVWLGVGFGLGRGYAEGDAIFRSNHGLRTIKA